MLRRYLSRFGLPWHPLNRTKIPGDFIVLKKAFSAWHNLGSNKEVPMNSCPVGYYRRILIKLDPPLWERLRNLAEREFRDPRQQAALIIRQALMPAYYSHEPPIPCVEGE